MRSPACSNVILDLYPSAPCLEPDAGILMVEDASTVVMLDTPAWSLRKFVFKALEVAQIGDRLSRSADFFLVSPITPSVIAVVFLLLISCATLREGQQYAREDALILARERYEVRQQACNAAGGAMIINTGGIEA